MYQTTCNQYPIISLTYPTHSWTRVYLPHRLMCFRYTHLSSLSHKTAISGTLPIWLSLASNIFHCLMFLWFCTCIINGVIEWCVRICLLSSALLQSLMVTSSILKSFQNKEYLFSTSFVDTSLRWTCSLCLSLNTALAWDWHSVLALYQCKTCWHRIGKF